jgi:hypothetical protein
MLAVRLSQFLLHALTRLKQKLLKQPAQLKGRAIAAVAHDGCRNVARAIDLPVPDRRAARSRIAPRAGRAALSLFAGCASLDFIHQKTKMRRFPCIFCWEATEGCIGERKP